MNVLWFSSRLTSLCMECLFLCFNSFCPTDSKFATCSDDGTVRIWDFMRCQEEQIMRGMSGWFTDATHLLFFKSWAEKRKIDDVFWPSLCFLWVATCIFRTAVFGSETTDVNKICFFICSFGCLLFYQQSGMDFCCLKIRQFFHFHHTQNTPGIGGASVQRVGVFQYNIHWLWAVLSFEIFYLNISWHA